MHFDFIAHLFDEAIDFIELFHDNRMVFGAIELQEDTLCAMHIARISEWRTECIVNGSCDTLFTICLTDVHNGNLPVLKRIIDVREVGIDIAWDSDDFGNGLGCITNDIIGTGERVEGIKVLVYLFEFLVVDDENSVHMLRQFCDTGKGFANFLRSFEGKRNGNNTNSKDIHFLCYFGDNRTCSGASTTTHSGSDKEHLRAIVQSIVNTIAVLLSILGSFVRIASGSETGSELQLSRNG